MDHSEGDKVGASEATPKEAPPLAELMTGAPARNLEAEALRAAREAVAGAERALAQAHAAMDPEVDTLAPKRVSVREQVLRGLLVINVVLMAGLLLMPDRAKQEAKPTGSGAHGPEPELAADQGASSPPFVQPTRERVAIVPDQDVYNQALRLADQGKYEQAVALLKEYLSRNESLAAPLRLNLYGAISHYAFQSGDAAESQRWSLRAAQLQARSTLPDDLLDMATRAEEANNGEEMRRAYARFLLIQRQIRPDLRRHVAHAYLKLGESFRTDAEQAEREEQARASVRQRDRDETSRGEKR